MGNRLSRSARYIKEWNLPLLEDDVGIFLQFINEYCTLDDDCFVRADLLDSAWIAYNNNIMMNRQHRFLSIPLAKRLGYTIDGNLKTPVILGMSLDKWPFA
jgi:hypothetical protein